MQRAKVSEIFCGSNNKYLYLCDLLRVLIFAKSLFPCAGASGYCCHPIISLTCKLQNSWQNIFLQNQMELGSIFTCNPEMQQREDSFVI